MAGHNILTPRFEHATMRTSFNQNMATKIDCESRSNAALKKYIG